MPVRVNIPGKGVVNFPDGMTPEEIKAAIRKLNGQPQQPTATAAPPAAKSNVDKAFDFGKDVIRGGGKQIKDIITSLPSMAEDIFKMSSDPIYRMRKAAETGLEFGKDPKKMLLEQQEGITGIKLAGDQPVGEKVGASAVNLALALGGLKKLRRASLTPAQIEAERIAAMKTPKGRALQAGNRAAADEPVLRKEGKIVRPAGERSDVGFGLLEDPSATLEALESVMREHKNRRMTKSMPPSEPPPMPKTEAATVIPREGPRLPGRSLGGVVRPHAEPATALGLAEESAAATKGKGALREITKKFATEEDIADLRRREAAGETAKPRTKKERRDAELDELADNAEKAALGVSDEAAVPGTTQAAAYNKGATPAQASATVAAQRAAESAAVRNVPRESLTVEGAAPGATAGPAKLPPLNKPRQAAGQPAKSVLPERPTVTTEMKAQDNRRKLLGTIKKLETGDSQVDQKARRIVYLGQLEKLTAGQVAEMAKLERELMAHPKVPDVLKTRWKKVNEQVAQSQRPATRAAEAVKAAAEERAAAAVEAAKLPTKQNGDTRPLSVRSEEFVEKVVTKAKEEAVKTTKAAKGQDSVLITTADGKRKAVSRATADRLRLQAEAARAKRDKLPPLPPNKVAGKIEPARTARTDEQIARSAEQADALKDIANALVPVRKRYDALKKHISTIEEAKSDNLALTKDLKSLRPMLDDYIIDSGAPSKELTDAVRRVSKGKGLTPELKEAIDYLETDLGLKAKRKADWDAYIRAERGTTLDEAASKTSSPHTPDWLDEWEAKIDEDISGLDPATTERLRAIQPESAKVYDLYRSGDTEAAKAQAAKVSQMVSEAAVPEQKPTPAAPLRPSPDDVAAAVAEALPKAPEPLPAKAEAGPVATSAARPAAGPTKAKGVQKVVQAIMAGKRPAGAGALRPLIEQSRQANPAIEQALREAGFPEHPGVMEGQPLPGEPGPPLPGMGSRNLAAAIEQELQRPVGEAAQPEVLQRGMADRLNQEFGIGTGYKPNIPTRSKVNLPNVFPESRPLAAERGRLNIPVPEGSPLKGFEGPTQEGSMKREPIVRKAVDIKAKAMKSFKVKQTRSQMREAGIPVIEKPIEAIEKARTIREQRAAEQATSGYAPPGMDPREWQRIQAVENEARNLVAEGIHDPRLISELVAMHGAGETATRIGLTDFMSLKEAKNYIRDLTNSKPRRRPDKLVAAEMEARFRYLMDDPSGFIRTETLAATTGAVLGGLAGATIEGEDATDRLAYALSGALIGGGLGFAGIRGVQQAAKATGFSKNKAAYAHALDTANLLASRAAIKASFGSISATGYGLFEKLHTGDIAGYKRGMRALKQAPSIYFKTLLGPTKNLRRMGSITQNIANQTGAAGWPESVMLNVLRPFIAADKAAMHVMKSAGFSEAEASRLLLTGEPVSYRGQAVINFINDWTPLQFLMKFPRVRIGAIERAAEFTPFVSSKFGQAMRSTKGKFGKFTPQERISKKQLRARAIFGGLSIGAGSIYGYMRDPSLAESAMASSAAGPAQIPAATGIALGKLMRRGVTSTGQAAVALGEPLFASVPSLNESDLRMLPDRLVPGGPAVRALKGFGLID